MTLIGHWMQADVDALVEFYNEVHTDASLDEAARALLERLEVTAEAHRHRGAVAALEQIKHLMEDREAAGALPRPAAEDLIWQIADAYLQRIRAGA